MSRFKIKVYWDVEADLNRQLSKLHKSTQHSLLYYSEAYLSLIQEVLSARVYHLCVFEGNELVAYFPIGGSNDEAGQLVLNSLPFYGSNGGFLITDDLEVPAQDELRTMLIDEFMSLVRSENAVSATIISNPLDEKGLKWYEENLDPDFLDERVGQITPLPKMTDDLDAALFQVYSSPRPRNIRRAIKDEIQIRWSNSAEDMMFLYETHRQNIEAIGGIAKEKSFFEEVLSRRDMLDYRIYIAEKDGIPISGLLLFYFNNTVEYFTPATVHEHRNSQPSALIIHEAMKESIADGFKFFNWGGTWLSQGGVYDFKKKWGAHDHPYKYFCWVKDSNLLDMEKEDILSKWPNFFVLPFSALNS